MDPLKVGTVVSATLYSLGCPTLAHRLVDHYDMAPTTDKYHLTGVACASGVPLMRLTAKTLRDHPGRDALIVAAELVVATTIGAPRVLTARIPTAMRAAMRSVSGASSGNPTWPRRTWCITARMSWAQQATQATQALTIS